MTQADLHNLIYFLEDSPVSTGRTMTINIFLTKSEFAELKHLGKITEFGKRTPDYFRVCKIKSATKNITITLFENKSN